MRLAIALLAVLVAQDEAPRYSNSYKDKAPPEITNEKGTWLNAEKAPTLKKLKDNPVLLVFTTLG